MRERGPGGVEVGSGRGRAGGRTQTEGSGGVMPPNLEGMLHLSIK